MGKVKVFKNGTWIDIQPKVLRNGKWDKATGFLRKNGQWVKITEEQYVEYFPCTWSCSYNQSGNKRTDNKHIYQGDYHGVNPSSTRGKLAGLIGFDYDLIYRQLQGAEIKSIELELYNRHWYYGSGGTALIGTHNLSSAPATYRPTNDSSSKPERTSCSFKRYENKTIRLPISIANDFKSGVVKGLLMWTNSTNMLYYGYFDGYGEQSPPRLKITYVK